MALNIGSLENVEEAIKESSAPRNEGEICEC